eukprot:TRINITY_DN6702_c0_g1_i1.p1 TRINITY_DN6702_c0_g1~~TRINITY_DN6702_c0_g1_i1.p1  ORF type:complete len:597 (+),score=109.66 TRINITY_DN6702_c0_g1_i1:170-1960(+)
MALYNPPVPASSLGCSLDRSLGPSQEGPSYAITRDSANQNGRPAESGGSLLSRPASGVRSVTPLRKALPYHAGSHASTLVTQPASSRPASIEHSVAPVRKNSPLYVRTQASTLAPPPPAPSRVSSFSIGTYEVKHALELAKSALRAAQLAKACAEAESNAKAKISRGGAAVSDKRERMVEGVAGLDLALVNEVFAHGREQQMGVPSSTGKAAMELLRMQDASPSGEQTDTRPEIAVKSRRKTERLLRRERALEKADKAIMNAMLPVKKKPSQQAVTDRGDPIRSYMRDLGKSKLLTSKEEVELARGIQDLLKLERIRDYLAQQMGREPTVTEWCKAVGMDEHKFEHRLKEGRASKDRMVLSNLRLVVSIAKNYQGRGLAFQDLIQEGSMGLIRGAEKFDHRRGFKFSTYAHWWVRQAVNRAIADQSRTVRLPVHMCEVISRISKAKHMLRSEHGRPPREEEVAELVGMSVDKLRMVQRSARVPRSMEQPVGKDSERQLSEFIADEVTTSPEEEITKRLLKQDLENVLHTLSPRERDVLRLRYGLDDGRVKTLEEIGHVFRVTRERIRQIESKAMRKLRQPQRNTVLRDYLEVVGTI